MTNEKSIVAVRLDRRTKQKLHTLASEKKQTVSDCLRELINRAFETRDILDQLTQLRWLVERLPSQIQPQTQTQTLRQEIASIMAELRQQIQESVINPKDITVIKHLVCHLVQYAGRMVPLSTGWPELYEEVQAFLRTERKIEKQ